MCGTPSEAHADGMFQISDYNTVRFLVDDHNRTYRPLPRRSLRRSARRAAADGSRPRS
jgi:hypothetical protein